MQVAWRQFSNLLFMVLMLSTEPVSTRYAFGAITQHGLAVVCWGSAIATGTGSVTKLGFHIILGLPLPVSTPQAPFLRAGTPRGLQLLSLLRPGCRWHDPLLGRCLWWRGGARRDQCPGAVQQRGVEHVKSLIAAPGRLRGRAPRWFAGHLGWPSPGSRPWLLG